MESHLRGYDLDGVLVPRNVDPIAPFVIISGRTISDWNRTILEVGSLVPIYLRPYGCHGDRLLAGRWKAEIIAALGVVEFYEDDPVQAEIIRRTCKSCRLVLVPQ